MKKLIVGVVFVITGCTDTAKAVYDSLGNSATIVCYSGGRQFYSGRSTGVIQVVDYSPILQFKDSTTGSLVRVSGDCLIQTESGGQRGQ